MIHTEFFANIDICCVVKPRNVDFELMRLSAIKLRFSHILNGCDDMAKDEILHLLALLEV